MPIKHTLELSDDLNNEINEIVAECLIKFRNISELYDFLRYQIGCASLGNSIAKGFVRKTNFKPVEYKSMQPLGESDTAAEQYFELKSQNIFSRYEQNLALYIRCEIMLKLIDAKFDELAAERLNFADYNLNNAKDRHIRFRNIDEWNDVKDSIEKHRILRNHNIEGFVHVTTISNAKSILDHGLMSRYELDKTGIKYDSAVNEPIDRLADRISVSASFPNTGFVKALRAKYSDQSLCVIALDPSLILHYPAQFFQQFAGSYIYNEVQSSDLMKAEDFEALFAETIENKNGWVARSKSLNAKHPTDVQAEILINGPIDSIYIDKILVDNDDIAGSLERTIEMYGPDVISVDGNWDYFIDRLNDH